MARAAGDDAALGGGGGKQGYPAASPDRAHGQPGTGEPRLPEWFGERRFHPTQFIHLLASLNLLPTRN